MHLCSCWKEFTSRGAGSSSAGGSELSSQLGTRQDTGHGASQGLGGAAENLPLNGNSLGPGVSLGWSPSWGEQTAVLLVTDHGNQVVL